MKVVARLQGMRKEHPRASAIYKLTILVGNDGLPQFYTRPRVIVLEPGRLDTLGDLRKLMNQNGKEVSDEQLVEILDLIASR